MAKHLGAPVSFEWAAPLAPGQAEKYRLLNPSLRLPILAENGGSLWEADAIACRLSQMTGSEFWRGGAELPDMIRWMSWARDHFMRACDIVHFERGTKQRYRLGPVDEALVAEGLSVFHESAAVLDAQLRQRDWLLASGLSYAAAALSAATTSSAVLLRLGCPNAPWDGSSTQSGCPRARTSACSTALSRAESAAVAAGAEATGTVSNAAWPRSSSAFSRPSMRSTTI